MSLPSEIKLPVREYKTCAHLVNESFLDLKLLKPSPGISMSEGYLVYFTLGLTVLGLSYLFVYIRAKFFKDTVSCLIGIFSNTEN